MEPSPCIVHPDTIQQEEIAHPTVAADLEPSPQILTDLPFAGDGRPPTSPQLASRLQPLGPNKSRRRRRSSLDSAMPTLEAAAFAMLPPTAESPRIAEKVGESPVKEARLKAIPIMHRRRHLKPVQSTLPGLVEETVEAAENASSAADTAAEAKKDALKKRARRRGSLPELRDFEAATMARASLNTSGQQFDTLDDRASKLQQAKRKPGGEINQLTRADYLKISSLWHCYDTKCQGQITMEQFKSTMATLNPSLTDHAESMFRSFDKDSNGVMTYPEFFQLNCPWASADAIEEAIEKWGSEEKVLDGTKGLELEEIDRLFVALSKDQTYMDEPVVQFEQLISLCPDFDLETVIAGDANGDGVLQLDEFRDLLRNRHTFEGGYNEDHEQLARRLNKTEDRLREEVSAQLNPFANQKSPDLLKPGFV